MDQLVKDILKHSEEQTYPALADVLARNAELLAKQDAASLDNLVNSLDASKQTLGVIAALNAKVHLQAPGEFQLLLAQVTTFTATYDASQVVCFRQPFVSLYHKFVQVAIKNGKALCCISVMRQAISKYQEYPTQLTTLHSDLVKLCLVAKCVKPVLPFLEEDMEDLLIEDPVAVTEYFLCYYYYGGMVYASIRNYQRSLLFFTVCLSMPTVTVSAIMLEAYKKYILVALLKQGKVPALPKYTSHVVDRYIKPLCGAYNEIAKVYSTFDVTKVLLTIDKYAEPLTRDNNLGLAKRVLASLYHRNVQKLTKTFLTLSLSDMASRLKLQDIKEAEKYLLDMIENKEIFASIDQTNHMVSFHDNPEEYNSAEMADYINQQMTKCMRIEEQLAAFDQKVAVDQKFIQRMLGGASNSTYEEESFYTDEGLM